MDRIKKIILLTAGILLIATGFVAASAVRRQGVTWSPVLVSNAAFGKEGTLPAVNTCDGVDVSPALSVDDAPPGTESLVLDLIDPSVNPSANPSGPNYQALWTVWNISPDVTEIPANVRPDVGMIGLNDYGKNGYTGPCPKAGTTQHYRYEAYALNTILDLPASTTYTQLQKAIKSHVIGYGALTLSYTRQSQ